MLFLRFLFGPGGIWRDKELEAEAEAECREELAELEEKFKNGKISEQEYKRKRRCLK